MRRRAATWLLSGLLALLMLDWGAASFVPRPSGFEPTRDIRIGEAVQPVIIAAAARTVAAKPRVPEKTRSPAADYDASVSVAGTEVFGFRRPPTVRRLTGVGKRLPVHAFDARAPPVSARS